MFSAGYRDDIKPQPDDLVVGVRGDQVRVGRHADLPLATDLRVIGFLDGSAVWAGPIPADADATEVANAAEAANTAAAAAVAEAAGDGTDAQPEAGAGFRRWGEAVRLAEPPFDMVVARAFYDVRWRITHRFCGECAGPLEDCPGFPTRRCPRCTTMVYVPQWLTPAVIVGIHSADRLLLVRHALGRANWSMVAGMVEPGESLEEAVEREVREEVGLEVTDVRYAQGKGYTTDNPAVMMAAFTAECAPNAVPRVDGVELTDARWFTRAEVRALPADDLPRTYSIAWPLIEQWMMAA